jgi:hypothetical protein
MQPLAADTPAHIEAEIVKVLRTLTPAQKAAMLAQMCAASDQLALVGIRMQHRAAPETWHHHLALRRLPYERQARASILLEELSAMTSPVNPVAIAAQVSAILDRLGIRHYIGGSFASSIYGEYRTTRDLDVVLQRPERAWRQLVAELRPAFTFVDADVTEALARVNAPDEQFVSFAMYDRATGYQVDMFLARNEPYERVQFERLLQADLVEGTVWVPSAEDAILNKLRWYALTPSDMQWRDVQAMLRVQAPSLDFVYLRTWSATLGIATLVEQAIAGEKPTPSTDNPDQLRLF